MGKKGSLKSALFSQQSRLKKRQEVAHAAQVAEKGKKPAQTKGKGRAFPQTQATIPFNPTDRILLIGEGNLSFARALVCEPPPSLQHLPPNNVTATAYDSEQECYLKYPEAEATVIELRAKGVEVLFGIDATKLEKHAALRNRDFNKIVWNFPHAGKGITDQDRNILSNQMLLLGFLRSAAPFLRKGPVPSIHRAKKREADDSDGGDEDDMSESGNQAGPSEARGTILVTLRNVPPYTLWNLPKLAKNPPPPASGGHPNPRYVQLRSFVFHRETWKGYEHRMTKGERAHGTGRTGVGGEDRTWEFYVNNRV